MEMYVITVVKMFLKIYVSEKNGRENSLKTIFKGGEEILKESLFLKLSECFLPYTYFYESCAFVSPS